MRILPERPPRLDGFAAPARGRSALWRIGVGAALAAAVWTAGSLAVVPLAIGAGGVDTRAGTVLLLASFAALLAGVILAARLLQQRRAVTLLGPGGFQPRAFALGVAAIALITAATLPALLVLDRPSLAVPPAVWATWLPLALAALLVQSGAEEVAFRGFLLQSLACRFRSPIAWWLLPSLLFGLLHLQPALGPDAWLGVLTATVMGLALADVTARTGNLSAAIGLHVANNAVAILLVAPPHSLSSLALFRVAADPAALRPLMLVDLGITLAAWAAWRVVAARRHGRSEAPRAR